MNKLNKLKRIFRKSVAIQLRQRGFRIIDVEVNRQNPKYDVYVFEDSEALEEALSEIWGERNG